MGSAAFENHRPGPGLLRNQAFLTALGGVSASQFGAALYNIVVPV